MLNHFINISKEQSEDYPNVTDNVLEEKTAKPSPHCPKIRQDEVIGSNNGKSD